MQKTTTGVLIAGCIIIGIAIALYVSTKTEQYIETPREEMIEELASTPTTTVMVKHQYKDGVHTFAGVVETPTPCYDTRAIIVSGDVNEIQIRTEEQAVEVCAQTVTDQPFKVSHQSAPDARFLMTLNGELVNMNQFDIDADVDIDTVEVLIKG
ncbi:MAG: hypothetical protein RL150_348 [Candidatus Parcubacteria bacterium]|jgi:hypothetical protein